MNTKPLVLVCWMLVVLAVVTVLLNCHNHITRPAAGFEYGRRTGIVNSVLAGGPAERAGIRVNDRVHTINGHAIGREVYPFFFVRAGDDVPVVLESGTVQLPTVTQEELRRVQLRHGGVDALTAINGYLTFPLHFWMLGFGIALLVLRPDSKDARLATLTLISWAGSMFMFRAYGFGVTLNAYVKVDCGYHRAGVDPASQYALQVARELGAERGLTFDGILSHSGHAYRTRNKTEAAQVGEQERQVMVWFADLLRKDGLPVRGVSVGSTPAMAAVENLAGVTEARPGNYIFYDRTMVLIGCCAAGDVGVTVRASVVSHQPGASHFVVDAGALSLSKDLGPTHLDLAPAMGEIRGSPHLTFASVSQEHGIVRAAAPAAIEGKFKVGDQVDIVPNHSCLTMAHFDEYVVMNGGAETARWKIERGR